MLFLNYFCLLDSINGRGIRKNSREVFTMKHNLKITFILLAMFLVTQLIGIYVVSFYSPVKIINGETVNVSSPDLPFGFETPELREQNEFNYAFASVVLSFMIAISLFLFL